MGDLFFDAPPTCAAFMKSDAFGRLIAGPVGSGKTTACVIELLRRAIQQERAQDGYRYTRFAVVRQTLQQLKSTVLKDCDQWLAANGLGTWKVSDSTYHVLFDDVRSEWNFLPLENSEDQARLLSMQLTGCWLSECIEMETNVLGPIAGRLGRYPSGTRGNPTWFGWIADTNFPVEMSPWHDLMESPAPNVQIFKQPGGRKPDAENLNFLLQTTETKKLPIDHPVRIARGRMYYDNIVVAEGEDSEYVNRYVDANYGPDPSGMAVFKQSFRSDFHIVPDTMVIPGYPILVGQDFGRNPWSLIAQADHMGRLIIHEEVPAANVGLEKHVFQNLRPRLLQERYLGLRIAVVGDPAGIAKGSIAEESCFDALKRMGLAAVPAPTNDLDPRLRAVEALLGRNVNGGPALIISRQGCPFLCRAMSGGYRFSKSKQGALKPKPEKLDKEGFSHVADCLQYLALIVHGGLTQWVGSQLRPRTGRIRPRVSAAGWT
jgi:hypothetical protein